MLIPEINVVRGKTYTFVIEGGYELVFVYKNQYSAKYLFTNLFTIYRNDPDSPAAYHPFYITDDKEGGYQYKKPEQRRRVRVFAGIGKMALPPLMDQSLPRLIIILPYFSL